MLAPLHACMLAYALPDLFAAVHVDNEWVGLITCKRKFSEPFVILDRHQRSEKMSEFLPLRKKLRRAETGKEDNFVPPYLPESFAAAGSSGEDFEKVI